MNRRQAILGGIISAAAILRFSGKSCGEEEEVEFSSIPSWPSLLEAAWKRPDASWVLSPYDLSAAGGRRLSNPAPIGFILTRGSVLLTQTAPTLEELLRDVLHSPDFRGLHLNRNAHWQSNVDFLVAWCRQFLVRAGSDPVILWVMPSWLSTPLTKSKREPLGLDVAPSVRDLVSLPSDLVFGPLTSEFRKKMGRLEFWNAGIANSALQVRTVYRDRSDPLEKTFATESQLGLGIGAVRRKGQIFGDAAKLTPTQNLRRDDFGPAGWTNCRNLMLARFFNEGVGDGDHRSHIMVRNIGGSFDPYEHSLLHIGRADRTYLDFWLQVHGLGQIVNRHLRRQTA